ncbi:hypothetical protein QJS10_CPB15g00901 [Acorus calamus]|uniref:Uncharacterized protein n=1 Tax=Acorus calamus TaxID=4465 RepID=A0AAV9D4I2_ACOCL|nr:hypothetical protein QJS10_CPB15g00901 [Acorus calamus]
MWKVDIGRKGRCFTGWGTGSMILGYCRSFCVPPGDQTRACQLFCDPFLSSPL